MLSQDDHIRAAKIGFVRAERGIIRGGHNRHENGGSRWAWNIESACAELEASLTTGLVWTGAKLWFIPPARRVPDLGEATEVRWQAPRRNGDYTLYYDPAKDDPEWYYMLVVGWAPDQKVIGWLNGRDVPQLGTPHTFPERKVICVPATALKPWVSR